MIKKKTDVDDGTVELMKRLLAMPPKQHDEMKLGRPEKKEKRNPKGRASSAKRRAAPQRN
jgi:hypothetical protein